MPLTNPAKTLYIKPDIRKLCAQLTPVQYKVTQNEATETPYENAYNNEKHGGIYVDAVSGGPLFAAINKFDSSNGQPSSYQPLEKDNIIEKTDSPLFLSRTGVRSRHGDSHLGHVFWNGSAPPGLRYCINSAAWCFILKDEMKQTDYGQYLHIFREAS